MKETEQIALNRFAKEMSLKLLKRKKRYKEFGWRDPEYKSLQDLKTNLIDEVFELVFAKTDSEIKKELIDVSNSAFIWFDRLEWDSLRIDKKKKQYENKV